MEQRYFFTKVHYKTSLQNIKTFKADSTCERFLALFRHNIVLFNENHNNEVHVKIDGNHGGGSFNNTFKEYVDKCTDLADMDRIGKVSDEIRFINDAIQMQLLHNPDVETKIVCQMYTSRLLELQTELTIKVN